MQTCKPVPAAADGCMKQRIIIHLCGSDVQCAHPDCTGKERVYGYGEGVVVNQHFAVSSSDKESLGPMGMPIIVIPIDQENRIRFLQEVFSEGQEDNSTETVWS